MIPAAGAKIFVSLRLPVAVWRRLCKAVDLTHRVNTVFPVSLYAIGFEEDTKVSVPGLTSDQMMATQRNEYCALLILAREWVL